MENGIMYAHSGTEIRAQVTVLDITRGKEPDGREAKMTRKWRTVAGLMVTAILWGASTAPAVAAAPVTTPLLVNVSMEPAVCDFPLRVEFTVEGRITRFFDRDGELVRRVVHVQESDAVFTNLATGATVERDRIANFRQVHNDELNLADEVTFSGAFLIIKTPGEPGAIVDAGRHTLDLPSREVVFSAGPKPFVDDGWAVLCPLLT
jgi:hypothetical protein